MASDAEVGALVTWSDSRELQETQQFKYVAPASVLSLGLTASELIAPRLRDSFSVLCWSLSAAFSLICRLWALALLALAGWCLNIVSSILFARARWSSAMANRVRLMGSLLAPEPAFFGDQAPGELVAAADGAGEARVSRQSRPRRALGALISSGGALLLMLALDSRLALVAVGLRAPLIGKLAEAAGRLSDCSECCSSAR